MSYNVVVRKKFVGSLVKDGTKVILSAATETSSWSRPESMADKVGEVLASSVTANPDKVPTGTKEMCVRESDHMSPADQRRHLTVICYDENGKEKTHHIAVE